MSTAPVYLCSSCTKPFIIESSRDRHFRYCKSRKIQRQRSCRACNKAKTKCSFDTPCLRCVRKDIDCLYEKPVVIRDAYILGSGDATRALDISLSARIDGNKQSTDMMEHSGQASHWQRGHEEEIVSSKSTDNLVLAPPNITLDPTMPAVSGKEIFDCFQLSTVSPSVLDLYADRSNQQVTSWCTWMREGFSLSIVAADSMTFPSLGNLMAPLGGRVHAQYSADLVVQSLRSLPLMMRRRDTFPWFIHPQSQRLSSITDDTLPEVLMNCMSMAQIFANRTKETRMFLWRNIRKECQRFATEMHIMTEAELLAAVQSCMIYLVMYIVDYFAGHEEDAFELLTTLYDLYMLFKPKSAGQLDHNNYADTNMTWEKWIAAESRRRLACLWFLVGCVVCIKNGVPCDTTHSYRNIPLPSSKTLWEAKTQVNWELEYEEQRNLQSNSLNTVGDLLDVQSSCHIPSSARKLDQWNAGTDGLGNLLNLVGQMV